MFDYRDRVQEQLGPESKRAGRPPAATGRALWFILIVPIIIIVLVLLLRQSKKEPVKKSSTASEKLEAGQKYYSFGVSSDKQQLKTIIDQIDILKTKAAIPGPPGPPGSMPASAYALIATKADKIAVSKYASSQQALYNSLREKVSSKAENTALLKFIDRISSVENQPVLSVSNKNNITYAQGQNLPFDTIVVNENNFGKITRESRENGLAVFSLVPGIYLVSFTIGTIEDAPTDVPSVWTLVEENSLEIVPESNTIVPPNSQNSNSIILKIPPGTRKVGFALRGDQNKNVSAANTNVTFLGLNVPSLLASSFAAA
jgi:hypothetical protein